MLRILPLIPLMLWLSYSDRLDRAIALSPGWVPLLDLLAGLAAPVALMAMWGRLLIRRSTNGLLPTRAFGIGMLTARATIVAWFGTCLYYFDYGSLVMHWIAPLLAYHVRLPGLVVSTLPVWFAWIGLWWAAYPVDRAVREQSLLNDLDYGRLITAPPSLGESILANLRSQVLFVLAPVMAAVIIRDLAAVLFYFIDVPLTGGWEALVFAVSILTVYVASPELLIRVLHAHPLPPSPLRDRLEAMASRLKLKYRDIMIWHTHYGIGNAAVMGLVPRFRYILLTDLLLETLDDEQIEAVFAHEAGHVQHRHLLWYVVFIAIFMLASIGPAELAARVFHQLNDVIPLDTDLLVFLFTAAIFLTLFGMLARLFEKQADVYAARAMGAVAVPVQGSSIGQDVYRWAVNTDGAESFVAALRRVAEVNHLPVNRPRRPRSVWAAGRIRLAQLAMNFLHPSIPDRVDHLRELATDPARTTRFDRKVVTIMLLMLLILMCLAAWAAVLFLQQ